MKSHDCIARESRRLIAMLFLRYTYRLLTISLSSVLPQNDPSSVQLVQDLASLQEHSPNPYNDSKSRRTARNFVRPLAVPRQVFLRIADLSAFPWALVLFANSSSLLLRSAWALANFLMCSLASIMSMKRTSYSALSESSNCHGFLEASCILTGNVIGCRRGGTQCRRGFGRLGLGWVLVMILGFIFLVYGRY